MDLSKEEKQRIYAEEQARIEAQETVKQKRDQKQFNKGCIGCLSVIAILVVILIFTGAFGSKNGEKARRVDINARVNFTGTQFVIENNDAFDWLDVKYQVNKEYELKAPRLKAGEQCSVGAAQFTKSNGTRFNPFTTKPKTFAIFCTTPDEGSGFYYGGWD